MEIVQLPVLDDNYIYLIHDLESGDTAAIDPALAQPVLDTLNAKGWRLNYILNTHHHWDHIGGNLEIKAATHCQIIGSANDRDRIPGIDIAVAEGDTISLGRHKANVLFTPGHTSGHIVYHFNEDDLLFCGDTLFVMGCGRLFEGSADQLWHSLQKLKDLPASTRIYCTHEYTQQNGRFALSLEPDNQALQQKMQHVDRLRTLHQPTVPSTIAEEIATNPFFRENSPSLQQALNMKGLPPIAVFTEIRKRKDNY
ncbi:MAG: hydroxyacylglutathione hydrolase [Methylococcaceae bacterium]|nr:hydroxyacylglutathione hydrolase [Methylococcaceae bacterium]